MGSWDVNAWWPRPQSSDSTSTCANARPRPRWRSRRLPSASSLADIVKTLVLKHSDGGFVFALVPGDRQIAWKKLRAVLGVNKLQLPDADQALEATGYERGTITPLGSTTAWPVVADSSITGRTVALGAGEHGWGAWVDADALVAALGATTADIT